MKNRKITKEWKGIILLMVSSVLFTIILLYQIVQQAGKSMQEEAAAHIIEITEQVKTHIDMRTKVSWDMIQNVEEMLALAEETSDNSVTGYLEYEKSIWGFQKMFLMSKEYTYYNEKKECNTFSTDQNLYARMLRGEYINTIVNNDQGKDVIYYMRAVTPAKYKDIMVDSVGISFVVEDLLREINISALEEEGDCYLMDPQGQMIVHTNNKTVGSDDDITEILEQAIGENQEKSIEYLQNMMLRRKSEAVYLSTKEGKSLVISAPMEENNWVLFTIIPEKNLNNDLNTFMIKIMFSALAIIGIMVTICIKMCKLYGKEIVQKKGEETLKYLEQALEAAQHSEKVKSRFLVSMSHDIRTPMNGIMGMSMLAKANIQNKGKVEYCLNKIDVLANHLVQLVNDVLDISQMESEKFHLNNNKFCLIHILNEVVELTKIQSEEKNQHFHVELDERLNLEVWADCVGIKKILLNVLSNAVKYTDQGGEIWFRANIVKYSNKFATVMFVIQDTGKGMEKAYLYFKKYFDKKSFSEI